MVLHEADRVVATHDIHGLFRGDIRQGTAAEPVNLNETRFGAYY